MIRKQIRLPLLMGCGALLLAAVLGAGLMVIHAATTPVLPADAYFYLSKAENLAAGHGLTTYWNDGIDRKFFPLHSIVLAPFSLLEPLLGPPYWIATEVLYYLATAAVLTLLAFRVERSRVVAFSAVLLWLSNPNVLLWHSVPYAEGLATLLMWSAVLVCSGDWRACSHRRFILASALAGLAASARAEAGVIGVFVLGLVAATAFREGGSAIPGRRLAAGFAIFCLPIGLWWLSLPDSIGSTRFFYIEEFQSRFTWEQLAYNFRVLFSSVLFEINLRAPSLGMQLIVILGSRLYLLTIGLAVAGALGRRGRWACLLFLGYQVLHAFWHYAYGRFNLLLLPLALYMFALGLYWVFSSWRRATAVGGWLLLGDVPGLFGLEAPGLTAGLMIGGGLFLEWGSRWGRRRSLPGFRRPDGGGNAVGRPGWRGAIPGPRFLNLALIGALVFVMGLLGHFAMVRHKKHLTVDDGRVEFRPYWIEAVALRSSRGKAVMVEVDFPLAYRVGRLTGQRVWFSTGLKDFVPAAFDPQHTLRFLRQKGIDYVLTYDTPQAWAEKRHLPAEAAERLKMHRRLPGARLLEWNG